jgi:hypothetical protein
VPAQKDAATSRGDSADGSSPDVVVDADLVEYLMVVVPELGTLSDLTPALTDLVASSAIRILDLVCVVRRASDGGLTILELEDVESIAALQEVDGEVGGLLSDHDIQKAAVSLEVGWSAILLLVEDRWADGLSAAARQAGGRVVGGTRITRSRVRSAIEAMHRRDESDDRDREEGE